MKVENQESTMCLGWLVLTNNDRYLEAVKNDDDGGVYTIGGIVTFPSNCEQIEPTGVWRTYDGVPRQFVNLYIEGTFAALLITESDLDKLMEAKKLN